MKRPEPTNPRENTLTSSLTLRFRWFAAALVLSLAVAPAAQPQRIGPSLTKLIDEPPLDRNHWGIAVLDARGRLLYGRNSERMFMPASNTKLIVAAAATMLLGPGSRVRSSIYAAGQVEGGTLLGDLILYGRGDPTWSRACFGTDTLSAGTCAPDPFAGLAPIAAELKRRGIVRIGGRVIGDGSYFEATLVHGTWEADDLQWGYGAPVSGLGFNENTVDVTVTPTIIGQPAVVTLWPDIGGLVVENRVTTVATTNPAAINWHRVSGGGAIVAGAIPMGGGSNRSGLAVADPNRFAALALARVLADSGISVLGGVGSTTDPALFAAGRQTEPLIEIESRPTADWVFRILNASQNWIAETLLKRLGRELAGRGSWDAGVEVERRFLIDSVALDSTQFLLHDGSGLSAKNAVTPLVFAKLLDYMHRQRRFESFAAGLPRSGSVGSLRNRFLTTPLEGRVRAKTGSIGQVNTLSGFIDQDATPQRWCRAFSVQANHHGLGGRAMIDAIDSVVVAIGRPSTCARTAEQP